MHRDRNRGFTLIELLVVIAIIALLIGILLPALGEARRVARLTIDIANQKQMATATNSYSADYEDRIFSFTWKGGGTYLYTTQAGDVLPFHIPDGWSNVQAGARQAVSIMRSRADRVGPTGMPNIDGWIPHVLYSHLVVQDYLASRLPEPLVVNPADKIRLNWQIDPVEKFDQGFWLPLQPDPTNINKRWPYSASYQTVPAAYDQLQSDLSPGAASNRIYQAGNHHYFGVPGGCKIGDVQMSKVAHPSGKVHLMQPHQRHFGDQQPFYGLPQARIAVTMFDGSVSVRRTADSNVGWHPGLPMQACDYYQYLPSSWEPDTISGTYYDLVWGYYRWTRGGLLGVDFGAHPLDTGQPGDIDGTCDIP